MTHDGNLKALFRQHLPLVDWQAIESALTGGGIPDMNGCFCGVEFWVENKKTNHWQVGSMDIDQVTWHERRAAAGGRTFWAVRRLCKGGPRTLPADELWLVHGHCGRRLYKGGLKAMDHDDGLLGVWRGGPSQWDWVEVLRQLAGSEVVNSYVAAA